MTVVTYTGELQVGRVRQLTDTLTTEHRRGGSAPAFPPRGGGPPPGRPGRGGHGGGELPSRKERIARVLIFDGYLLITAAVILIFLERRRAR